ncbi:MAG: hypothetical protein AAFP02_09320, partial [Bacteroidota bacterium]
MMGFSPSGVRLYQMMCRLFVWTLLLLIKFVRPKKVLQKIDNTQFTKNEKYITEHLACLRSDCSDYQSTSTGNR